MLKLPFYSKTKLILSFEYGLTIAHVAAQHNIELTPEIVNRAEEMMQNEFSSKSVTQLSVDMMANVLSIFETNLTE